MYTRPLNETADLLFDTVWADCRETDEMQQVLDRYFPDHPSRDLSEAEQREAAEEFLAHLQEVKDADGNRPGWFRQFIAKVRLWLRQHGFMVHHLSDDDLAGLLARAANAVKRRAAPAGMNGAGGSGASSAGNGGMVRYSIIGERGAGNLGAVYQDNLRTARAMLEQGKDAKTVKLATGWEKGADGFWRMEIPDLKIRDHIFVLDPDGMKFGELAEAPELFSAYPEIADIPVYPASFQNEDGSAAADTQACYSPDDDAIYISAGNAARLHDNFVQKILIHEVQHKIQHLEGFQSGGSPEQFKGKLGSVMEDLDLFRIMADASPKYRRYEALDDQVMDILLNGSEKDWEDWCKENESELNTLHDDPEVRKIMDEKGKILKKYGQNLDVAKLFHGMDQKSIERLKRDDDTFKHAQYRRLTGEVEARNAASRSGMTAEEKRNSLLDETADVAPEDRIYLAGDGRSMMSPLRPPNAPNDAESGNALRDNNVPHAGGFMEWAGLTGKRLYADYEFLYARHWNTNGKSPYFNSPEKNASADAEKISGTDLNGLERTPTDSNGRDGRNELVRYRTALSQADRDLITLMKPIVGQWLNRDDAEYAALFRKRYGVEIDPAKVHFIAYMAVSENKSAAARKQWRDAYDFYRSEQPLFDFVLNFAGEDPVIRPSDSHFGEEFTGSFISPEFVKYSMKRPQGKKESDKVYKKYLARRQKQLLSVRL